ncbi:multidrug ABC transporter permease/ATPase [Nitzschia inconspicua]|uniref:Multidrug ABC transporter permease/ATPase n=1 Tax=Nitzschia inconspicua TaxID=303405 RepID=A0A9K3KTP0_9STRA|nr:multidrug ABC transporter permease/ATPase [Nitzschia inconspicua]
MEPSAAAAAATTMNGRHNDHDDDKQQNGDNNIDDDEDKDEVVEHSNGTNNNDEKLHDGMEEIPLNGSDQVEDDDMKNKKKDDDHDHGEPQRFPWWQGGGIKPQNGTDLGVWDQSLEDRANCISLWWMSYLNPLLSLGSRKVLDAKDVGVPSQQDRAERAYQGAKKAWEEQLIKARLHNAKVREEWEKQQQEQKQQQRKQPEQPRLEVNGGDDAISTDSSKPPDGPPEKKLKEPSMSASLVYSFGGWRIALAILFQVISALLSFVPVIILNDLVGYFEWYSVTGGEGRYDYLAPPWVEVIGLGVVPFVVSVLQTRHNAIMAHCGVFVRTAVSTLLYRKALNVSAAGRAKTSTGQVVNMMSNDTMQLQRFLQFAGFTVVAPLQIIVALVLIYRQVGNATWVGVAYMVFLAPINIKVFGIVASMRRKVLKYSDMRVKMMNEILTGIRIIKFYAWERPFGKEVSSVRGKEMDALTKLAYTVAVGFSIILLSTPIVQPVIVFVTYVNIQDQPLTAATAFTTVALFNLMRFPFAFMPMGLLQYIQSKISLKRLERYLALPELNPYVQDTPPPDTPEDSPYAKSGSISIIDGSFGWVDPEGPEIKPVQDEEKKKKKRLSRAERKANRRKSEVTLTTNGDEKSSQLSQSIHSVSSAATEDSGKTPTITLQNITCQIAPGSLVAVVGSVGSGKSSLLSAILGEMESIHDSKVYVPRNSEEEKEMHGFASYCTQSPWVVNDTLRGNILFGREYNEERYNKILYCCALLDDIAVLPAGDMTEIGERGINLSGGQKARVGLARAMYSADTRMLLLDDPLSAVDSHVGEHLFSQAIAGDISKGKTRVLVTHHVHVLARCDKVIVMDHGKIKHQGTYQELVDGGVDFAGAVDVSRIQRSDGAAAEDTDAIDGEEAKNVSEKKEDLVAQKKAGETLVKEEEREEGDVAGTAYIRYARAGGWCIAILTCVIQGLGRSSEIMSSFWLARWSEEMQAAAAEGEPFTKSETSFYVGIYGLFGFLAICGLGFRGIFLAMHRLRASQKLHDGLTEAVLRAPVAFFDVTPIGRILNRFAADMDKVDLELTQTISQGMNTIFQVLGALGGILVATKGTFIVALIPLGYLYYLVQRWFRKTSTELQRVTSVANSPIFADFSQTLSGTSTIRAYGVQKGFFDKCKSSFDTMNASYILVQLSSYWLALRLDVMGGVVGMFIGAVALSTLDIGLIPAGWLGLALSYSIEVTSYLKFGVQMIARMEADMSSVERILFYTDNIEPEAPDEIPEKDPPKGTWPTKGEIDLSNASMRYRDGPLVLKHLSLTVNAGEKIGVCGRTGSGKSSLMIALFRISEIEKDGTIVIDGVNTREIGTAALRLNISIIPQDPVMFSNTVRYNLDPFATATDEELWEVLKKVQMAEAIATLPKGLDEEVAEGGENFSQGQRQLLCIARSLLRKPKILVMDEATASIDNETDATIQRMIRENFQDATVLTIAHRLNTIMDSDRILVLDDGHIAELDTPESLLAKEDGHFKAMVEKSRAAQSNILDED